MKKALLSLFAGTAFLAAAGMASAAEPTVSSSPMMLSSAQMDGVTAGARKFSLKVNDVNIFVVVVNQVAIISGDVRARDIDDSTINRISQVANVDIRGVRLR